MSLRSAGREARGHGTLTSGNSGVDSVSHPSVVGQTRSGPNGVWTEPPFNKLSLAKTKPCTAASIARQ
eukprot:6745309-Pyramimonas_sp.AAC.1